MALGDFNGDGKLDLATANSVANGVTVLLGDGTGGFTGSPLTFPAGTEPKSVAVGDFNGDGKLDLATANYYDATAVVLLGSGDGYLQPGPATYSGFLHVSLVAGDFNGDGKTDLVFGASGTLRVLLGDGMGGFAVRTVTTGNSVGSLMAGDFNTDGKLDLVTLNSVLLGDGAGGFMAAPGSPFDGPQSVAVGDLNGDGKLDLATINKDGSVAVLSGNGAGGLTAVPGSAFTAGGSYPKSVGVGDFNRDGRLDLAIAGNGSQVRVLLNTPVLQSITVSPATASIVAGRTQQVTATGRYLDNSTQDLTAFVTWSSSNTGIASISNAPGTQGMATGVWGGSATITAALAGLSATASLSVQDPTLQSLTVSPATASIVSGATQQFTATGRYSDNSTKDLTASVTWSSSNTGIASISNSASTQGMATGVSPGGPVTITATLNGAAAISASASATVSAQSLNPNRVWGVNAGGQIYRHLNGNWSLIPSPFHKPATQVSAAADGTVWALDSDGNICSWKDSGWQIIPGTLRQLSVGRANNAWGVSYVNTIYRWNGSSWTNIPGPANRTPKEVSAAMDGTVWLLDTGGNIHSYTGSSWQLKPGTLAQVSAGNASNVWGVTSTGSIFQ